MAKRTTKKKAAKRTTSTGQNLTALPAPKKKTGPKGPIKLDAAVTEQLAEVLRLGCDIETAVAYCGLRKQTLYNWLG